MECHEGSEPPMYGSYNNRYWYFFRVPPLGPFAFRGGTTGDRLGRGFRRATRSDP